jgi:hypothetical protein
MHIEQGQGCLLSVMSCSSNNRGRRVMFSRLGLSDRMRPALPDRRHGVLLQPISHTLVLSWIPSHRPSRHLLMCFFHTSRPNMMMITLLLPSAQKWLGFVLNRWLWLCYVSPLKYGPWIRASCGRSATTQLISIMSLNVTRQFTNLFLIPR